MEGVELYIHGGRQSTEPRRIRANLGGYVWLILRLTRVELAFKLDIHGYVCVVAGASIGLGNRFSQQKKRDMDNDAEVQPAGTTRSIPAKRVFFF